MFRFLRLFITLLTLVIAGLGAARAATPAAPTDLVAYAVLYQGTLYVELEWGNPAVDEDGIEVQYRPGTSGAWSSIPVLPANRIDAELTGVPANATYQFQVRATKSGAGNSHSAFSNIATVVTAEFGAPFNLQVAVVSPFSVSMKWEEASTTESGFAVEFRAAGGSFTQLGTVQSNVLYPGTIGGFSPGTAYEFRVRAFLSGTTPQYTAYSPVASVTMPTFPQPQNVTAVAVSQQPDIQLSWQDINSWEAGTAIQVKRIYESDSDYITLGTAPANATGFLATGSILRQGGAYVFRLWALLGEDNAPAVVVDGATDGVVSRNEAPIFKGLPFSYQVQTSAVGTARTDWSVSNLPDGLMFDPGTGAISGTPTVGGLFLCPMTAQFANGWSHTKNLALRVVTPAAAPVATTPTPWETTVGGTNDIVLSSIFSDPDIDSAVRVTTTKGVMDFGLYDSLTPATVENFKHYVADGDYSDSFFHRSLAGFVIQGGGFKPAGNPNNYTSVPTDPPVINEPGINNLRGTISMAKSGGSESSGTCQFFVSLGNNIANLDNQNGGFAVFGRVLGSGMTVADAIAALPTGSYVSAVDGGAASSGLLSDCPMDAVTAPGTMDQSKLVVVQSMAVIPTLAYSVTSNAAPSVVSADGTSTPGHLTLSATAPGLSTIAVQATDLEGSTATANITVVVRDTLTTWAARQNFTAGQSGAGQNPDGDLLTNLQEYAFLGNPNAASASDAPAGGTTGSGPTYLTLAFKVRSFAQGLTYTVEGSSSLVGPWQPVWTGADGFAHAQIVSSQPAADHTAIVVKDTVPISPPGTRFLRVKVQQQ